MSLPPIVWGSTEWAAVVVAVLVVAFLLLMWSYARIPASWRLRTLCATLKAIGITALVLCLLEPQFTGKRARPGANAFAILVDNSESQNVRDGKSDKSRGEQVRDILIPESPWKTRLGQDFDVRRYEFDTHLRSAVEFEELKFNGQASALATSLSSLSQRFRGLPLAGVLLLTDGNRTDFGVELETANLPPIYPLLTSSTPTVKDIGVTSVSVSRTNFDAAPVIIRTEVAQTGFKGEKIVAAIFDEAGQEVERQTAIASDGSLAFRFQFRPERSGLEFFAVKAFAESDEPAVAEQHEEQSVEPTLANNSRTVVVDQGGGPYRVLYVAGRPNWEYKFLRRAVDEDDQIRLVGLLRIARKQPKFDFQAEGSRTTSPLYQGFDNADDTSERFDDPVLVRIGTEHEVELRDGFPKSAEELYRYHAVILDDVEAAFFTQDQLALLRNFVSARGGGLLMLGGPDSFADGKYDRTPVGEMLPVYLNREERVRTDSDAGYRLKLTREGWLQPWVRTRKTEDDERRRLETMPALGTINPVAGIKPGAAVLAQVTDRAGRDLPALAVQPFGNGHVAANLLADIWKWSLRRNDPRETDAERAWRQTVRWLVSDVPERVEIDVQPDAEVANAVRVSVRARDAEYRPLDNAAVSVEVRLPNQETLAVRAAASESPGAYSTTFAAKTSGPYRITAKVHGPDGSEIGSATAGWVAQPAADEFQRIEPDREALTRLAAETGGEVIDPQDLESFVASLPSRKAPVTEPWTSPLWHSPIYFLIAISCVVAEWGLRRFNGLT